MKTWKELSPEQQEKAIVRRIEDEIRFITEAGHRYPDDDMNAKIEKAIADAENMMTPWFIPSYVYDAIADDLRTIVVEDLADCMFTEPGDPEFITGII